MNRSNEVIEIFKSLNLNLVNEEFTKTVLEYIFDPIFVVNENCEFVFMNASCKKILQPEENKLAEGMGLEINGGSAQKNSFKINCHSVKFDVIPVRENDIFLGAVGIGKFSCIEEIYNLTHNYRNKKSEEKVGIKFKPKRLLHESMQQIIGYNIHFVKTLNKAAAAAKTDATVMIYGESGAGKQMIAEAIHKASNRSAGPFVEVNCAAIPENLLESELFGYDSYSFTGALKKGRIGRFEAANNGTVFLDEIGEMSLNMQAKLLRVLQFKELEKIGGTKVTVNARVVAATNKSLDKMVQKGTFREDLYYRLNVIPIHIKPLRERKDDLVILVDHFMDMLSNKYGVKSFRLSTDLIMLLHNYCWPGNIRELENVIEYALISAKFDGVCEITLEHLPEYFLNNLFIKTEAAGSPPVKTLPEKIKKIEAEYISKTLQMTNSNKSEAIKLLGISRGTFYSKLREYGLSCNKGKDYYDTRVY